MSSSSPLAEADPSDGVQTNLEESFNFVCEGLLLPMTCVMGICGNLASLAVLSRTRSSINVCLQALASFDACVLATAFLMIGIPTLDQRWGDPGYNEIFPYIAPLLYPMALIAQTGSVWTTVTVTVERYVAVCHPLKARVLCTYGRARLAVVLVTFFSVAYNLPRFWEVERAQEPSPDCNCTLQLVVMSGLRKNKLYFEIYFIWLYLFVMYFVPFLSLAVLNCFIWQAVRRANKCRARIGSAQDREISLATMLLCVVAIFFVCNILAPVANILEYFESPVRALVSLSNLLVTINSSVNFIVYCIFGQKFKRMFLMIFCRCFLKDVEDDYLESVCHQDKRIVCINKDDYKFQKANISLETSPCRS